MDIESRTRVFWAPEAGVLLKFRLESLVVLDFCSLFFGKRSYRLGFCRPYSLVVRCTGKNFGKECVCGGSNPQNLLRRFQTAFVF
jgi:hypothetical protein